MELELPDPGSVVLFRVALVLGDGEGSTGGGGGAAEATTTSDVSGVTNPYVLSEEDEDTEKKKESKYREKQSAKRHTMYTVDNANERRTKKKNGNLLQREICDTIPAHRSK